MKKKLLKITSAISAFSLTFMWKVMCFADDVESLFEGQGAAEAGGPLEPLMNVISYLGQGATSVSRNGAIYVSVISMIFSIIGLVVYSHTNGAKASEKKESIGTILIAVIILGAVVSIISLAFGIGSTALSGT